MKSIILISDRKINDHAGEYYDEIVEVPHQPTSEGIESIAADVREKIRRLWKQDVDDNERDGEPVIKAFLDGASPFNAMLIDYQIVLGDEGIKLELPYLKTTERTTQDPEAQELLQKLDNRGD